MDVANSTAQASQAAQPAPGATASGSQSTMSADFETFLKMLTVQMRNQDPLNPVEGTDFAVQLATFSTVEQQVRTNDLLGALGDKLGALGFGQLLGWVGMEARTTAAVVNTGAPVEIILPAMPEASTADLVVTDEYGTERARQPVPVTGGEVAWVAVDSEGRPLPEGAYNLTVEGFADGNPLSTRPVEHRSEIVEARHGEQGTRLLLGTGQEIAPDEVLALRNLN
ncbi:flagellar hook capping FlgD N-terminal domain-containing protein [Roseovarius sp. C7]|uniref:flagellar hook capping FlgD N-terminal domain-containing protein n=1 Tax=Roseovarius sp. C7 TaxID=3398643 RepID=UPI0039F6A7E6